MKPTSFRDEEFFIPYQARDQPSEQGMAINDRDVVFDLGGDETQELQKQKAVMKWDMKSKKYTMMEASQDGKVGATHLVL